MDDVMGVQRNDHTRSEAPARPFHNKGSARMFRSDVLEWLSHVHPATPAVIFVPVAVIYFALSVWRHAVPPSAAAAMFFAGYLSWTLLEYWLHRMLFHVRVRGPRTERLYFFVHGVHHDWPWDTSRLVMPPSISLLLALGFHFIFRGLLGAPHFHAAFAGFVAGYVLYDTIHWLVHVAPPRSRLLKWLRREHLVHHFKDSHSRFGVSCPWWDHVFGTTGAARTAGEDA